MAKCMIWFPMEVIVMCYRKISKVENKEIYCIKMNLKKDKVGDYRNERNKLNTMIGIWNDVGSKDMLNNTSIEKKCVSCRLMIGKHCVSKNEVHVWQIKSRGKINEMVRLPKGGKL